MEPKREREDGYRNTKQARDKSFSCNISPAVNVFLDFLCKHCNYNKTHYVNKAVMEKLQKDMQDTKVEISMQDLFNFKNTEDQTTETCEQYGIGDIPWM